MGELVREHMGWFIVAGIIIVPLAGFGIWKLTSWIRHLKTQNRPLLERSTPASIEANWPVWQISIRNALLQNGWVESYFLSSIPPPLHVPAMRRYVTEHPDDALIFCEDPPHIELANRQRMKTFLHSWKAAWELIESDQNFGNIVFEIASQLCDILGFVLLPHEQRVYHSLHAFVVRAPALRLKVPPRFPIVFVRRREGNNEDVADLRNLMSILNVTSLFALIIDMNDFADRLDPSKNLRNLAREVIHDFIVLDGQDLRQLIIARDPGKKLVELMLQQVDLTVVSPYVTSGPVPENMFFGRDHELKTIARKIDNTSFALVGGRKIGKTSILAKIYRLLSDSDERTHTLYLDCQPVTHYASFFQAANAIWLAQPPIDTPESLRHYVVLEKQESNNVPILILLDEIDALLSYDMEHNNELFHVFRALSQENRARFVFCGERVLSDQLHDANSPLFNFCDVIRLGYLKEQAVQRIILEPMKTMGVSIQDQEQVIQKIVTFSSCHPNLVQYLCQQLILEANSRHSRLITPVDLQTVRYSSRFQEYFLQVTWGNTGPLERVITLLIANQETLSFGELQDVLARRGFAVPQETLERAISGLRLYSILIKDGQRYRFASKIFAEIIKESQEVDILLASLRNQLREQAEREGWRPSW